MSKGGVCVKGPLHDDGVAQVGLLQAQAQAPLRQLPEGQRRGQDEGRVRRLGLTHKVLHVADPVDARFMLKQHCAGIDHFLRYVFIGD